MTFEEFKHILLEHKNYNEMEMNLMYIRNPFVWSSCLETKRMFPVEFCKSYIEETLEEEIQRAQIFRSLNKMYEEQDKLERLNQDFL